MSTLKSYAYEGVGEFAREHLHYAQAIRVGDQIHCSGQGGWDTKTNPTDASPWIKPDIKAEIDRAFANVDLTLKNAGGKGWEQVYKIRTYSIDILAQQDIIVENMRKWMPNHQPVWTALGVKGLGDPSMNFEIEVEAHDPEGAKAAGS